MNGSTLALGAVGALALLGAARRGSRSSLLEPFEGVVRYAADQGVVLNLGPYTGYEHGGFVVEVRDLVAQTSGTGAGTRVMQALISAADEAGLNLILHPATPRNVRFYERFGFEVSERAHGMMFRYAEPPEEDE